MEKAHQQRERAARDLSEFEATRDIKDLSFFERQDYELLKSAHARALENLDEITKKNR